MDSGKLSVSLSVQLAAQLDLRKRRHQQERADYKKQLEGEKMSPRAIRLELARVAPDWWPSLDVLVSGCVRRRLAEPDLAGPWAPLTEEEAVGLRLSGRWPGPAVRTPVRRSYLLPSDLIRDLRTASWRVSAPALETFERQGLTYDGHWSASQLAERRRLAEQIHSPSRIVRQALERYARQEAAE
ncbi:hypothetical protein ACGF07_34595 [Kitasatospora sp. NPDC048194]|uniref:hypothetical protein n=1 Tax=Kitasatospora sp. NPDC048194 TaxID=3364045 RepID=UPI003715A4D7